MSNLQRCSGIFFDNELVKFRQCTAVVLPLRMWRLEIWLWWELPFFCLRFWWALERWTGRPKADDLALPRVITNYCIEEKRTPSLQGKSSGLIPPGRRSRVGTAASFSHEECSYLYLYNLPKLTPKPTPSPFLYTALVGVTESHTERDLSSSHPNRCLYSVLAFMGYAYSPMLCATNTHAVRVRPCTNDAKIFWKIIWNPKRKAELKSNWATLVI